MSEKSLRPAPAPTTNEHDTLMRLGFPADNPPAEARPLTRRTLWARRTRELIADEAGAVTAEYALVVMAAVAFAGLLIVILRSEEVRATLLSLVQNALNSAG